MSDLECPYCEAGLDVNHDDEFGFGCDEDVAHQMKCKECGKTFVFHTVVYRDYDPQKADCLNGSNHRVGEWYPCGIGYKQRRGEGCDQRQSERKT